jgi:hypothetical protein
VGARITHLSSLHSTTGTALPRGRGHEEKKKEGVEGVFTFRVAPASFLLFRFHRVTPCYPKSFLPVPHRRDVAQALGRMRGEDMGRQGMAKGSCSSGPFLGCFFFFFPFDVRRAFLWIGLLRTFLGEGRSLGVMGLCRLASSMEVFVMIYQRDDGITYYVRTYVPSTVQVRVLLWQASSWVARRSVGTPVWCLWPDTTLRAGQAGLGSAGSWVLAG